MHNRYEELDDLDLEVYIISSDTPEQQSELYKELEKMFGFSVPFISDPNLEMIDLLGMKNGDIAYRGYGILDQDGQVVFKTVNDHWGEQFDKTVDEIKEEYEALK